MANLNLFDVQAILQQLQEMGPGWEFNTSNSSLHKSFFMTPGQRSLHIHIKMDDKGKWVAKLWGGTSQTGKDEYVILGSDPKATAGEAVQSLWGKFRFIFEREVFSSSSIVHEMMKQKQVEAGLVEVVEVEEIVVIGDEEAQQPSDKAVFASFVSPAYLGLGQQPKSGDQESE